MLHRVIFGSIERFIGILIEHYAGRFPTWISPIQVEILPITDRHIEHCLQLEEKMKEKGIRVEVDVRNEKIGYKIREAQLSRIPYMLIIGDKEIESEKVSVRSRDKGELGAVQTDAFIDDIVKEIEERQ